MKIGSYVKAVLLRGENTVTGRVTALGDDTDRGVVILCEPSGAVDLPVENVEEVKPFPFTNPWADDYFDEDGEPLPEATRIEIQNERKGQMREVRAAREPFKELVELEGDPIEVSVGDIVKMGFTSTSDRTEWMWVTVTKINKDDYEGELDNNPVFVDHSCGDTVKFKQVNIKCKY